MFFKKYLLCQGQHQVPGSLKMFFKISSAYDHVSLSVPKQNLTPAIIDTRCAFRFIYPKHTRGPLLRWTRNYHPNLCSGNPSTFSLELLNTTFHNSFAVVNIVKPCSETIDFGQPTAPIGKSYTVGAVSCILISPRLYLHLTLDYFHSSITNVLATSGRFSISAQSCASTTTTSSVSGSAAISTR